MRGRSAQRVQGESGLGLHPCSPLPPPELGLVLFDVPAEGGGRGTDPRIVRDSVLLAAQALRVAAGLSGVAPGDQDGGRSGLGLQRGQVSKGILGGRRGGIGCSLESQSRDLAMGPRPL